MAGFLRTPGTLWVAVDDVGMVCRCSAALPEVLGFAPESVVGRRALLLVHRADLPVAAAAAARVVAGDEVTGVVLRVRHAGGGWRRVRCSARRAHDGIVHVIGRDVTAADAAQGAAGAHEALVQSLLDHMPLPAFVEDLAGTYRFVNRELCTLAGASSPKDMVGRRVEDGWPGVSDVPPQPFDDTSPAGRRPVVHVGTVDGPRHFGIERRMVPGEGSRPDVVVGVAVDVTDRESAAHDAQERGQVLDAILAASPDVIAILDRGGRVLRHNAAITGIVGFRRQQVLVDDALSAVHPDDVEVLTATFADLLAGQRERAVHRYRLRHQDGRWVTVESRARVERDRTGRVSGMVVVTRDVSGDLVAEARMRAAVAAAEEANRANSVFLSRMSHELRTPLNSILGFAQLLQLDELSPSQSAEVAAVLAAGRRLLPLIDEALDIARIETGHLTLVPQAMATGEVLSAAAGPGDRVEVADGAAWVWADGRRLRHVVDVLVSAGRRRWGDGAVVCLSAAPGPPGWVRMSLRRDASEAAASGAAAVPAGTDAGARDAPGIASALARHLVLEMGGHMPEVPDDPDDLSFDVPVDAPALVGVLKGTSGVGVLEGTSGVGVLEGTSGVGVLEGTSGVGGPGAWQGAPGSGDPEPAPGPTSLTVMVVSEDQSVGAVFGQLPERRPGVRLVVTDGRAIADILADRRPDVVFVDCTGIDPDRSPVLQPLLRCRVAGHPLVVLMGVDGTRSPAQDLLGKGVDATVATALDLGAVLEVVDAIGLS